MTWGRSDTLAMARMRCQRCHGYGLNPGRHGRGVPCNCVLRAIFRACYERYLLCQAEAAALNTRVYTERTAGRDSHRSYGRKPEEYTADFDLVSRRALDALEYGVFRLHYLERRPWRDCCRHLRLDRGTFFHAVYRVERTLGRVFRELEPFALFPPNDYFTERAAERAA